MDALELIRGIAEGFGRLADVVLLKPRLGEPGFELEDLVAGDRMAAR